MLRPSNPSALPPHRTDDRKAIRLTAGRTDIRSSLDLIKTWADNSILGDDILRGVLVDIRARGNHSPSRNHPFKSWWDSIMAEP